MQSLLITVILIVILLSLYSMQKNVENYSSLDIYYPNPQKKQKPDICGECGVLCQYCKDGINQPIINKRSWNHYAQGYLNPNNPDLSLVNSPKAYKCLDDKTLNKLVSANYVYIYSDAFKKSLSFESYGDKSYVYVDPKMPNENDCLTTSQYNEYCKSFDSDVISYPSFDKHLPQKWRIDIKAHNPNICLVTISSYSCDGLKYYLTAHQNGNISASVFGGSNDQVWQIFRKKQDDDMTNILTPESERDNYLIQSYRYNIYLTASNDGYMRRNAGNTSLTNVKTGYIGKEHLWKIKMCGKRSLSPKPEAKPYKPMISSLDYPNVDDNVGPQDALSKDMFKELKISKNVNKKWSGRSVWMPEFDNVWEGNYQYKKQIKQNKKVKINDKNYKVVTETKPITLGVSISLNNSKDEYPLYKTGKICIDILETQTKNDNIISGNFFKDTGLDKDSKYTTYNYSIKTRCYKIKSSSAGQFYGIDVDKNKIFIEHDKNRSGKDRVIITFNDTGNKVIVTKTDKSVTKPNLTF